MTKYHVEGVLDMVRYSEWRRRGAGGGIQVFDGKVKASADDGWYRAANESVNEIGTFLLCGRSAGNYRNLFARFDLVTIPAGATIDVAYLIMTTDNSDNDGTGTSSHIYLNDEDDPIAVTSKTDGLGRARTTAFTEWDDEDFVVDAPTNSPSIVDAVQEIIDRGGWNSGQAMQILMDNDFADADKHYRFYSYDEGSGKEIALHVEYTT